MSFAVDRPYQWIKRRVGRFAGLPRALRAVPFILKQSPSFAIRRTLREAGTLMNLLDRDWYLSCYPDAAGAIGALRHYLRIGAALDYDPNPYFSTEWYSAQNPDVSASGLTPIVHFIRVGAAQGRNPGPEFDVKWYLKKYPDVAASHINPLEHFIVSGRAERRLPNRFASGAFHSDFFSIDYRDQLGRLTGDVSGEPLAAFNARSTRVEDLLPSGTPRHLADTSAVHVVVPVYRGVAETIRCIESVLASRAHNRAFGKLIVVDDCTPEPDLAGYLTEVAGRKGVVLVRNARNMGFVASVNRGIAVGEDGDVILLNSDTEVTGDWVDRLACHARSDARIATVTPFSNNATICSYPNIEGMPDRLPANLSLQQIDRACAAANAGRTLDLPTGVGSCMWVTRRCLREIGGFDEAAFGRGYGEETDFCQRAIQYGWRNVLAADVFMFHVGEVSFGRSGDAGRANAAAVIRRRHPNYYAQVAAWIRTDPARPMRFAVTAALGRASGRPAILHVLHSVGGGTEKHVADLIGRLGHETTRHIVLVIGKNGALFNLSMLLFDDPGWRAVEFNAEGLAGVARMLGAFAIARVHLHHFLHAFDEILPFVRALDVAYDLTIHDYMTICPRIFLLTSEFQYCEEPDEAGCTLCLTQGGLKLGTDIVSWRKTGTALIEGADRVICPSIDVARRIGRYAKTGKLIVAPHDRFYKPTSALRAPELEEPGRRLRVALIGGTSKQKGGSFLLDCVQTARDRGSLISWHVVGELDGLMAGAAHALRLDISSSGRYEHHELPEVLGKIRPHLVFFAQRSPETYSYTLSEAYAANLPVLAPEIGPFPERTAGIRCAWTYPLTTTPDELIDILERLRDQLISGADAKPDACARERREIPLDLDFYRGEYLRPLRRD